MNLPNALRVLIVEDVAADAELMAAELNRAGFDTAWERVDTEDDYLAHLDPGLDVIIADYRLEGWDGLRALELLQRQNIDVPFIVVSGTLGDELAADCVKRGADDYVLKDRLERLGQATARALEQRQLREKIREAREAENALREARMNMLDPTMTQALGRAQRGGMPEAALDPTIVRKLLAEFSHPADASSPFEQLTQREVQVISHLARGQTNREIAAELVLSYRTIDKHVSNILAKLHLANRTQAAIYAALRVATQNNSSGIIDREQTGEAQNRYPLHETPTTGLIE